MNNLAQTYSDLGRHADALAMQEKVLEHLRRVLPADHPDIGEGCAWSDASTSLSFDCDSSLRRLGLPQLGWRSDEARRIVSRVGVRA